MHTPVLLQQAIENLAIRPGGLYIDATFGEGGHSTKIIKLGGRVLGIELDNKQIFNFQFSIFNKEEKSRLKLVQGNFKNIEKIAKKNNFFPVDGILLDLGLSMNQISNFGRGFSFKNPSENLDMRMDTSFETTAKDLVNSLSEDQLYEVFAKYSEDLNSRIIAKEIIYCRNRRKIERVKDFLQIIDKALKVKDEKTYRRIFQALRIVVNEEDKNLKSALQGAIKILNKSGRLVVITFHSLEDRIVKNFIKKNNLTQINKKVIKSDSGWRFERSAKMRVIEYEKTN